MAVKLFKQFKSEHPLTKMVVAGIISAGSDNSLLKGRGHDKNNYCIADKPVFNF